jgi:hypothetical protein
MAGCGKHTVKKTMRVILIAAILLGIRGRTMRRGWMVAVGGMLALLCISAVARTSQNDAVKVLRAATSSRAARASSPRDFVMPICRERALRRPCNSDMATLAENGLARAKDNNGRYGFINARGEWVIPPKFKWVFSFDDNGLAGAQDDNGKMGFINAKGEWGIPPKFGYAGSFEANGLASVQFKKPGPRQYIDFTGRSVVPVAHDLPTSASMKVRPMNYLALSYDHRIIDGREAVLGLVRIKEALEDPARLVLGV